MATKKDSCTLPSNYSAWPVYGAWWWSQTFTAGSSYTITDVILPLSRDRAIAGNVKVSIRATDGDGLPTGSDLTSVATKRILFLQPHNAKSEIFRFSTTTYLTSGTKYAIVVRSDATTATNSIRWWYHPDSGSETHGPLSYSQNSGSTWASYTGTSNPDFGFETYTNYETQDNIETGSESNLSLGGAFWGGQTFTTSTDYILKSIELRMARVASDTDVGAVIVSLRATDVNGRPSGEDLVAGMLYSDDITHTTKGWEEFTLDTPYKLSSSTKYAIIVRTANSTYPGIYLGFEDGGNIYADGTKVYSEDSGETWADPTGELDDCWFRVRGTEVGAGESILPDSDAVTTKRLIAIGSSEFWYENADGDMVVLSDSIGDIDTTKPLTHVEAYGKIFIANETNLKIADFVNVKITTTSIGTHPPDFGTVLTGSTSGATMVVDYADAIASAVTIYGRRTSSVPFQAETVTGLDDDENNISFTCTAEVQPPHWYDWTVFGNSSTFGVMPTSASLVSLYNGRLVLAGSKQYPHQWWMSKVYNPFNFLYSAGDTLTAVSSGSTEAGEIGDIITALIPYGDDFFAFGCISSAYILDGDPTYGGTIENLTDKEGIYGARSWCKDSQGNLYFFSGDGLYKAQGGRRKPVCLSGASLPNWATDWELDPDLYRVVLSFDPAENGILISHTSLLNGSNKNYWYSLKTEGFYPEELPESCGIFSSYYYNAANAENRTLLFGCNDGYIRKFNIAEKNDVGTSSDETISSHVVLPIQPLNDNLDEKGKLITLTFEIGGGVAEQVFEDTDSISYEIHVGDDAETVLENIKYEADAFTSGSISTTGRSNKIRPRARGQCVGIKLYNTTSDESWAINKCYGTIIQISKRR